MKIIALDLISFGPFSGGRLDLGKGDAGLHLVYGPNEAGKSSALRALRHLLYGIPERSDDDFIHPYSKLRIGGTLEHSDGSSLSFVRRKGRRNTLRDHRDDALLDESQLARFLGAIDGDLFAAMFGIDHADLVRGGREIIQGGGTIGELLFAAGSGISRFREVLAGLQEEAESLFKPTGKNPVINRTAASLDQARRELRLSQLSHQEWRQHHRAFADANERKSKVQTELSRKQTELSRLQRIQQALPFVARWIELKNDCENLSDAPDLSPGFRDRRLALISDLTAKTAIKEQTARHISLISRELERLPDPAPWLQSGAAIEALYQELGSHRKAGRDRLKLEHRKKRLENDIVADLQKLGKPGELSQAGELRMDRLQTVALRELASTHERLTARLETVLESKKRVVAEIEELNGRLERLPETSEPLSLQNALDRMQSEAGLENAAARLRQEIERTEDQIRVDLTRQTYWSGPMDAIETLPLPSLETLNDFETRFHETKLQTDTLHRRRENLQQELNDTERGLAQLIGRGQIPSERELQEQRRIRDDLWSRLARTMSTPDHPDLQEQIRGFEAAMRQTDEVADRLRREADRVALKAKLETERTVLAKERDRCLAETKTLEHRQRADHETWLGHWAASGIQPDGPREMRAWVQQMRALGAVLGSLKQKKSECRGLEHRLHNARSRLIAELVRHEKGAFSDDMPVAEIIDLGRSLLDRLQKALGSRRQILAELDHRNAERNRLKADITQLEASLNQWRERWDQAMDPLGLASGTSPAQAMAFMEDSTRITGALNEIKTLETRLRGIDRDAAEFSRKAVSLAESLAPEYADHPADEISTYLMSRLTEARDVDSRRKSLRSQKQSAASRLEDAKRTAAELEARLEALCQEAGCRHFRELPDLETRSEKRRDLQAQLSGTEEQLRQLAGGAPLTDFVETVSTYDADCLPPRIDVLNHEIDQLTRERSVLDQTIGQEQNELEKMDGSDQAAQLAQEIQVLLASLEESAVKYGGLRVAAEVLSLAMERYRQKNQGPILKLAVSHFARLTHGAFESLRIDINDKGDPVLLGVRPGGKELVPVEGMSDGTADQLFLAIRLASLEKYLESSEPMPFIVDDILINFDDRRASAALSLLAELSRKTQIIFFTHHRHLVSLATQTINPSDLICHTLDPLPSDD